MIEFYARHQTAANLLMLLFLAAGVTSLPTLKRETFPDFTPGEVEIRPGPGCPSPGTSGGRAHAAPAG